MSKDRARAALDAAKKLTSQGQYKAALKKHVWFHYHALEVRRSYYGVRLSFALSYWMDLVQKYPPALTALRRIRDKKTKRLLEGKTDRALFHDVESINAHLKEPAATVELFKKIDKINAQFASAIYYLADETIIAAGEYGLAIKHFGDPAMRFEDIRRNFQDGMQHAETSKCKEAAKRAHRAIFVGDVVRLITVLDKAGQYRIAKVFQSKALDLHKSVAIRKAIKIKTNKRPKIHKAA
jgi:tetratricopeptide (TPR) repeat protein